MIKEYDKIRLKTGERGAILEIFDDDTLLVEYFAENGKIEIKELQKNDVKALIQEVEVAL